MNIIILSLISIIAIIIWYKVAIPFITRYLLKYKFDFYFKHKENDYRT